MGVRTWIEGWPVYRQLADGDRLGRGAAVRSSRTKELKARTSTADRVVKPVRPYCAVAGSACTRLAIFEAGRASAANPKYTVMSQRNDS